MDEKFTETERCEATLTFDDVEFLLQIRLIEPDRLTGRTLKVVDLFSSVEQITIAMDDTDAKMIGRHCALP